MKKLSGHWVPDGYDGNESSVNSPAAAWSVAVVPE